jgi:flagellar export protein FliJ
VKAFSFRLEQALRWRETQVSLQKARLAAAAGDAAQAQAALDSYKNELASGARQITLSPTGNALDSYSGFVRQSRPRIQTLQQKLLAAQNVLATEMNLLIAANQKLHLLANLKETERGRWQREFDRELSAFADEAFLSRSVLSKLQSKKRTGA